MAPPTYLNTATLSEALGKTTEYFKVSAVTNITAKDYLVFGSGDEAMLVVDVDATNTAVRVNRGVGGSIVRPHATSERFFIGSPDKFSALREYSIGMHGFDNATLPFYCLPGARAKDGRGYEYLMVDISQTGGVYTGVTCVVSNDGLFTAAVLAAGVQGSVGVVTEPATSNQYCWLQTYGYFAVAQDAAGDSAATSALIAVAASSVSTPAAGMATFDPGSSNTAQIIYGMFVVGAASSLTTSAASFVGTSVPVWLHHPYTLGFSTATQSTASASS